MKDKNVRHTTIQIISRITLFLLLGLGLIMALKNGQYADFKPMNGTFQNYNPVRRFLSGQIPCRDFQDYLGMGHLYSGSLFTALFGGNYRSSLIAFSFLIFLSTFSIFYTIGAAVGGRRNGILTAAVLFLIHLFHLWRRSVSPSYPFPSFSFFEVGNSARLLRGMIMPAAVGMLYLTDQKVHQKLARILLVSACAALCFLWSNDYGIGTWLCLLIMIFFISLAKGRKLSASLGRTGLVLSGSLVFVFLFVQICTLGHFSEWLSATFGTGGYQYWYYNGRKSFYIYSINKGSRYLIQACLALVYLILMFVKRKEERSLLRYGIPCFMNMVNFCVVNEYKLLSGGNLIEVASTVLIATIAAEILNLIGFLLRKTKRIHEITVTAVSILAAVLLLVADGAGIHSLCLFQDHMKKGTYIAELGGYNTSLGEDLVNASKFLNHRRFFSTYASAQEVKEGQFHPSGTDYIIHVLGDRQRQDYLDSFQKQDFDLAVTIREDFSQWEFWVTRANWFFYRELYENWHPVFANAYELYWERNSEGESHVREGGIQIEIEDVSASEKAITVHTDPSVNGIADVLVSWKTEKTGSLNSHFILHSMVRAGNKGVSLSGTDLFETNYLRSQSTEYLPIQIVNGYGEITLESEPKKDTFLTVEAAECQRIFTVPFEYIPIQSIAEENGNLCFSIHSSKRNRIILSDAEDFYLNGNLFHIRKFTEKEDELEITAEGTYDESFRSLRENENVAWFGRSEYGKQRHKGSS